ncbi:hypothetical protein SAMN06272737_1723 [Blastococcus mobilis]|uniref:Uncharacterized protein n=1 Tax=Blastococcus mobilis TaxID=1938746 RepID=A0A239B0Y6_9ACTN|nr:hypothetical protein SAMN06272737_1723 [Blastococcus mobilis]
MAAAVWTGAPRATDTCERGQPLDDMCTKRVFLLRVPLPDVVSMQTRQANLEGRR